MTFLWILLALLYLATLFGVARWGERDKGLAKRLTSHPATYALAIAIYCTAWTFFGAVGEASRNSWGYLPILLGPMLVYLFGYRFLVKLAQVSKRQHITTIADFIASRYGKRQRVAFIVTLIALMATIPYIALQLIAIDSAFQLVSEQQSTSGIIIIATAFIAVFSIYFGTQRSDVTEYRRGLVLAIAFESLVKLLALALVGALALFWWLQRHQGFVLSSFFTQHAAASVFSFSFFAQTIMAGAAVICLPRQFHVAIVENPSIKNIATARWLFPLYLAVLAVIIPIISSAGQTLFANRGFEPDHYVMQLALFSDLAFVKAIVFIGGLSAATAMIIVATLTLSTMITNDVIFPSLLARSGSMGQQKNYGRTILHTRRIVIAALLAFAFIYQHHMRSSQTLSSIGLVAFSLVVQLLPAIIGGLYWRRGHAYGVYAGLIGGVAAWFFWLALPFKGFSLNLDMQVIAQAAMVSLGVNTLLYATFSFMAPVRLIDRIQSESYVGPKVKGIDYQKHSYTITNADLITLLSTFLGKSRCHDLLNQYEIAGGQSTNPQEKAATDFLQFCERALGGVIGAASAKALVESAVRGKKLNFEEVVNFLDDTTQAMQFNMSALLTSIESIDQGISVVDKNLQLVAWNKRYLNIFQYPPGLVQVGTPIARLVRHNAERGDCGVGDVDTLVEKRLEHMRRGSPHRFVRQRSDGRTIEMIGNPLPGGGFVTSFNDITNLMEIQRALEESNIDLENRIEKRTQEVQAINEELHREISRRSEAEQELITARQAAEDANISKTRFLALASHDILQPLNAAKLYLSALNESKLSEDVNDIVDKLGDSVAASETLIATLLDIARMDQGQLSPKIDSYSLSQILRPLADEFSMKAQKKGLTLKLNSIDTRVSTDYTHLYRILQNLISNAVKYTENGKILVSCRGRKDHVLIQVRDTGIGISDEDVSKIFRDFYRVDDNSVHGVGLGLAVVNRLSQQLNTPISVSSIPGRGSCFSLCVPITQSPSKQERMHVNMPNNTLGMQELCILCVDDKPENLDALKTLLQKWQAEVHLAYDPADAIAQAKEIKPDMAIIDYQLGEEIDGLSLITKIREVLNKAIPALLISASQEDDLPSRCNKHGVSFLSKPLKPAKLRAFMQNIQHQ